MDFFAFPPYYFANTAKQFQAFPCGSSRRMPKKINRLSHHQDIKEDSIMSTLAEAYYAEKEAESQRVAERVARVKEFVASSDPNIIDDMFHIIEDAVVEHEAEAILAMTSRSRMQ